MKIVQTTPLYFAPREDDWSNLFERAANINLVPGAQAVHLKCTGHFASQEGPEQIAEILLNA